MVTKEKLKKIFDDGECAFLRDGVGAKCPILRHPALEARLVAWHAGFYGAWYESILMERGE